MYRYLFILFLIPLILSGCGSGTNRNTGSQNSFCYWNTTYSVDTTRLQAMDVQHMYIRYFDVDWNASTNEANPIASIRQQSDLFTTHFTPSVYLTNKVFQNSNKKALDSLSVRIKRRIDDINRSFATSEYYKRTMYNYSSSADRDSMIQTIVDKYDKMYSDILIDCDWTKGTKDNFFYFVNQLKKDISDKSITVTLRLWQYKQRETSGIPPVDRCLLMCYNMQTANDFEVGNSIASINELKKYISGEKYPLPLDIALPVFNWAVLFRNEEFVGLLGNVDIQTYETNLIDYKKIDDNRYKILNDMVIGDFFARRGDVVRVEAVSPDELEEMSDYLKKEINIDKHSRITFFTWNNTFIDNYGTNELKKIYSLFFN